MFAYRYGFNGKEKSSEITSDDYDFGARIYDGRIGRWLSIDSKAGKYPMLSPYNYSANNPVVNKDVDGRDYILSIFIDADGKGQIQIIYSAATTAENKKTFTDGMGLWQALNGTEIKINDIPFKVNFITTITTKETFDDAKNLSYSEYTNFYSGNTNAASGEVIREKTIPMVYTASGDKISGTTASYRAAETFGGSSIQSRVIKIVPDFSALSDEQKMKFSDFIKTHSAPTTDNGKDVHSISHEIGHTLGLNHNGTYDGGKNMPTYISPFDAAGVMSSKESNPTVSDLKNIIIEALHNNGKSVFNSDCQLNINIGDDALKKIFPKWDGKEATKPTQTNTSSVEIK